MSDYFLGIDPGGVSGAWAIVNSNGAYILSSVFTSFKEFSGNFKDANHHLYRTSMFTVIERAASRPLQGSQATFSYGMNYGGWLATLEILEMPFQIIDPKKWQKEIVGTPAFKLGMKPSERRELIKARNLSFAQHRWPSLNLKKKDHGIVDALCIAMYARRLEDA